MGDWVYNVGGHWYAVVDDKVIGSESFPVAFDSRCLAITAIEIEKRHRAAKKPQPLILPVQDKP